MAKTQLQIAEEALEEKYLNKFVKYSPVGRDELYGKIDRIALDNSKTPFKVIFNLDSNLRYEEDADEIHSLLTLL